ncbi:MAG TPA: Gfo/Idh/MocA family oxidoreductase [Bryobacteraceae bacterium]|nr:Gfo/Idh/MocA family oxidoreductase [Bryobacteraceae bacterium]
MMLRTTFRTLSLFAFLTLSAAVAEVRIGIIGTDTSHVVVFTRVLNDPANPDHISGFRVVAAVKGGSADIPSSRARIEEYAGELHSKWNVELVDKIGALSGKVDAILLESVDGRLHLEQARQAFALHKPMFIDKPLASTLDAAREIARLAAEEKVAWFSASSLRFGELVASARIPDPVGITVWGPGPVEEHHELDLSWYGIHPVEMLYALMGPGCETVTRMSGGTNASGTDVITGRWRDGRIGTVRVLRPNGGYGAVAFGPKEIRPGRTDVAPFSYVLLLKQIVKFFETGVAPVSNAETMETISFMDAAQRSKQAGGQPMRLR